MIIRSATDEDIPAIVNLLTKSLGNENTLKSESYWRWKHIDNPFGQSPVLLGFEGSTLVGVRAFLRWRFRTNTDTYETVRAVDTATHPEFRGRGIFNKLTLSLLHNCEALGTKFVFNTPNGMSKPGYLKMGWREIGRLPVNVKLNRPFSILENILKRRGQTGAVPVISGEDTSVSNWLAKPGLLTLLQSHNLRHGNHLITDHSLETLSWRYKDVNVAKYYASGIEGEKGLRAIFFYRIKSSKVGRELRISDIFIDDVSLLQNVKEIIDEKMKKYSLDYATVSDLNPSRSTSMFGFKTSRVGPVVTARKISMNDLHLLSNFSGWKPSIGDLELF